MLIFLGLLKVLVFIFFYSYFSFIIKNIEIDYLLRKFVYYFLSNLMFYNMNYLMYKI